MIILNELNYAEECIRDGFIGEKPFDTLSILAKYYYHHCGYRKKQIVKELTEFMIKTYPRYKDNKDGWDSTIEKIATSCKKYKLYEIEGVSITKTEWQKIAEIHDKVLERLAFTILCLAKLANQKNPNSDGWINEDEKQIFSLARISCSVVERNVKIGKLASIGILSLPKKNDSLSIKINIMETDDANGREIFIGDFRELGYEYMKRSGQNFIRCAECGILVRGNKNGTKKYCSSCIGYTPIRSKQVICCDCGTTIDVNPKNNKTIRCEKCQEEKRKTEKREAMRSRRNSDN